MTDLPPGWAETTLGELGHYWNGRAFKKEEWQPPGEGRRPIIRIQDLTRSNDKPNYFEGEVDDRHVVRQGDVLVSWAATLGVYEWRGAEAVVNQHIFKVASFIDRRFHRHLIDHVLDDLRRRAHGTGMVHVTRRVFDETRVLLPPLAEQDRIVAVIEEEFSRLDAAQASLRSARHRLTGLPARLIDESMAGWPTKRLGDLIREPLRNGHSAKRSEQGNIPVFTLTAVTARDFSMKNTKLTGADRRRVEDLWAQPGDIFIERSNTPELVGTAALYTGRPRVAVFPDLLIRVRVNEAILPEFADLALRSSRLRRYFQRTAKGIAGSMPKIDQATIEAAEIPLPPLPEQERVVSEIQRALSICAALESSVNQGLARGEQLRRSILDCAVSGRLVPQDPSDEPASAPLERIAAERTGLPKARRRKRA